DVTRGSVHGVDRSQDLIAPRGLPAVQPLADEPMTLADQRRVPEAAVLLIERDEFAARRDAGGAASLDEQHQREESGHFAVVRHQRADQASESDRLRGELVTHGIRVGSGREVALVEDEVENGEYAGNTPWERLRGR